MTRPRSLDVPSAPGRPRRPPRPPATRAWPGSRSTSRPSTRWSLREAIDGCVAAGLPASGLWREPVAEVGSGDRGGWLRDAGLRVSSVCRGGFFTVADAGRAARAPRRQPPRDRRGRPSSGAHAWCWSPAACPPATATSSAPGTAPPRRSARWCPHALERRRPARPSSRCTRSSPPTAASSRRWARPSTSPSSSRSRRSASSSTPSTSGGSRASREQIARAGERIASLPGRATGSPRCPPDALLSRGMMGDGHIDFRRAHRRAVAAAGYAGDVEVEIFNADVWARRRRRRRGDPRAALRRARGAAPLTPRLTTSPRTTHLNSERS